MNPDFWHFNIGQLFQILSFLGAAIAGGYTMLTAIITNRGMTQKNSEEIGKFTDKLEKLTGNCAMAHELDAVKNQIDDVCKDVKEMRGYFIQFLQAQNSYDKILKRERPNDDGFPSPES